MDYRRHIRRQSIKPAPQPAQVLYSDDSLHNYDSILADMTTALVFTW